MPKTHPSMKLDFEDWPQSMGTLTPQSRLVRIGSARPLPPAKVSPNNHTESPALPPCGVFFHTVAMLLHATIEEFAAEGFTHVECYCPRCRVIRLRPASNAGPRRLASRPSCIVSTKHRSELFIFREPNPPTAFINQPA
jgi:hypothetical protein